MRAGMKPITLSWLMLGFAGVVWASYLVYMVFEEWWYLRFLLPSYPFLIALAAAALLQPLRRFERPDLVAFGVVAVIAYHGISFGADKDLFTISRGEARYKKVGEFVARELPERSLLLSMQHSGSLRYYGHRTTVRYDFLPHDRLDEVVAHFQARGWSVYIVVDEWEEDTEYRSRFSAANKLGKLDWTPIALWSVGMPVRIYDPRDRGATTPVVTRRIE